MDFEESLYHVLLYQKICILEKINHVSIIDIRIFIYSWEKVISKVRASGSRSSRREFSSARTKTGIQSARQVIRCRKSNARPPRQRRRERRGGPRGTEARQSSAAAAGLTPQD